jgi:hypothetical protein
MVWSECFGSVPGALTVVHRRVAAISLDFSCGADYLGAWFRAYWPGIGPSLRLVKCAPVSERTLSGTRAGEILNPRLSLQL